MSLIDFGEDFFDGFEFFAGLCEGFDAVSGVLWGVTDADESFPGFGHEVRSMFCGFRDSSSDHECEAGHFSSEFGDDSFGHSWTDTRECAEGFDILFFDGDGDFADGSDHGTESFLDTDAVDGAELFEEFEFGVVHEADDAGCQSSLLGVPFEEFDGAEADIGVEFCLELAADNIREEYFVFEATDADGGGLFGESDEGAGDACDHGCCPELSELGGEAK